ncbi:hypothetical protein [Haloechinothrix sp. LS1_15]|uniref:hypothetical protein n=1 Tax=Haloechinothrix sp. LS1_15 TaxID=2652248 RepID=UPI002944EF71|nr:hypothetical protein [Haloechinothrix sp. LS1_15]MDV6013037.1 hypothetical protein [Haloechinothrix sp. LS1_15]
MVHGWFGLVAGAVWRYLDEVADRAGSDPSPAAPDARTLAAAWRALLRLHDAGLDGRSCRRCRGCRSRRRRELCLAWQVAIAYFVRRLPGDRDAG